MHIRAVTVCAGLLTTAVVFSGPAALADGITVNPSSVRRGEAVTISGAGCMGGPTNPDTGVTITSTPLRTVQESVTQGQFSTTNTVRWNAPSGRYTVQAICKPTGQVLTGSIDIKFGGRDDSFGSRDNSFGSRDDRFGGRDDSRQPGAFPRTGGGGMAAAAEGGGGGLGGVAGVAGAVLLAGALGLGAVTLVRARARGRG